MLLRRTLQASIFKWQNFSTSNAVLSKAKKPSPLAELRKKSGYSLTLCKDALAKNENDVTRAFQWLDVSCMVRSNLCKDLGPWDILILHSYCLSFTNFSRCLFLLQFCTVVTFIKKRPLEKFAKPEQYEDI